MIGDLPYQSSEELQRHNRDVFASKEAKEKQQANTTERDKIRKVLDQYISKHKSTDTVRKMAKEAGRTADEQLDLSAELVEILTKIKSDLR